MSEWSFTKSNVKCQRVSQRVMSNVRAEFHKEQCQMSESITKSDVICQSRVSQRAMSNVRAEFYKEQCQSRVSQRAMPNVIAEFHKEQCQMPEQSFIKRDVKFQKVICRGICQRQCHMSE